MIIGLVLIAVLVYFVVRKGRSSGSGEGNETPLELLKKRYINGEISKEEFQEMRETLGK